MRLVFAAPAARDLESIIDYIALNNPGAAEEIYRTVLSLTQKLTAFPEMGRAGRLPGTRELLLPSLPYLIVYEVSAETVTILAVFHGARDLVRAFEDRLKKDYI
jgi:toxin ParE1/3/4